MNKKIRKGFLFLALLILCVSLVHASYLDIAKESVEAYYKYSQEKNVDAYIALFDQQYLRELYGPDAQELFREVFTYFEILDYDITFQQYTEGNESLSLFFHLRADARLDGKDHPIDQDLIAFFSKSNGAVKLRYIMLQSLFSEVMIAESTFMSMMRASFEDELDLVDEAIAAGIINFDEIEESMEERKRFFTFGRMLFVLIIGGVIYIFHKNRDVLKKTAGRIKPLFAGIIKKTKPTLQKTCHNVQKWYAHVFLPTVKKCMKNAKHWYHTVLLPKITEVAKKVKMWYHKKVVPFFKKLSK